MKRFGWLCVWACCALAVGGIGISVTPWLASPAVAQSSPVPDLQQISDRFALVAERVSPAVVAVEASKPAKANSKETTAGVPALAALAGGWQETVQTPTKPPEAA